MATETLRENMPGTSPLEWFVASENPTGPQYANVYKEADIPTGESMPKILEPSTQLALVLAKRLKELMDEIRRLQVELAQRPLVSSTLLHDLGDERVSVKAPISVVLEEADEEALARWPETRSHGIGNTLAEAISELKKDIVELFFDLSTRDPETLGEVAIDTLGVLRVHIQAQP